MCADPRPTPSTRARPLFSARATFLFRAAVVCVPAVLLLTGASVWSYYNSPYWNGVGLAVDQPVMFSHRHHAGELRLDCRYCHAGVETAPFAGMPDAHTCLTCHSQLFTETSMLAPVVLAAAGGEGLAWNRVNDVPDHVFFNHSAHVAQGIGCVSCHGEVDDMALTARAQPLTMRSCLECHREVSSRNGVHDPRRAHLTNCSTCHH